MTEIELLAPARDLECGRAAIDCGADAVYLGAPRFGARESAGNSLDDIAALVEYAHKYWARVYVTLNTLLHDGEIPQAVALATDLHSIGIDGLIIQDTGLLECDLPPIPLIASTQMHNNTPEKVAFLEKVGFSRVILARELDIEQIKAVREKTSIELEFFIHGALCVCYSGQCYLSYALGGRSGNRGQCAQPCRKPYSLLDASGRTLVNNNHLLSLKDLNLSDCLSELIRAGVCSFKIEGRLKDKAYVANVVAFYRNRLDRVMLDMGLKKSSSGTSDPGFEPDVDKTFNRGYTTYFLHGRDKDMGRPETPKMVGEEIGRVLRVGRGFVETDSSIELHPGDGVCFFDKKGELRGSVVNAVRGRAFRPDKWHGIEPGTLIYRNHDHEFLSRVNKAKPQRLIGVVMSLGDSDDGLALRAVDEDGNGAEFAVACERPVAQKPEQAIASIRAQLSKTGGTPFTCREVKIDLAEPLFVPVSILNALRRGVLDKLTEVRHDNRPVRTGGAIRNDVPYPARELTFEGNVLNALAREFYLRHGVTRIEPAAESGLDMRRRRVMTTRYCLRSQLGMCGSDEPLTLVDSERHRLELRFDCGRCEMEVWLQKSSAQ
jgi:collagenase-like PrtC family protease